MNFTDNLHCRIQRLRVHIQGWIGITHCTCSCRGSIGSHEQKNRRFPHRTWHWAWHLSAERGVSLRASANWPVPARMYSARDPLTVSTMAATSRIRRLFLWVAILADFKMPNRSAMPASTTQSLRSKACNVWHQTRCPWSPSSLRCVRYWTTSGKLFTKVDAGPACDTNLVGEKLTDSKLLLRSSPWSNFVQARKYPWAWLLDCTCVTIRPFATWDPSKAHIIVSTPVQASSKNRTWPPQPCDFLCAPGPSVGASVTLKAWVAEYLHGKQPG